MKQLTSFMIAALMLAGTISYTARERATNHTKPTEGHFIGEGFGGGIVFHVFTAADGTQHGLIASLTITSDGAAWGKTNVTTAATDPINGAANTAAILKAGGNKTEAAGLCDAFEKDAFTDWYLPASDELKLLQKAMTEVNKALETTPGAEKLDPGFYWSSTENARGSALGVDFTTGSGSMSNKLRNANVRAIRAF